MQQASGRGDIMPVSLSQILIISMIYFLGVSYFVVTRSAGKFCSANENWRALKYNTKLKSELKEGAGM